MTDFGNVIKLSEFSYNVLCDIYQEGSGYNVVSKVIDPFNKYSLEEVRSYCKAHPDKVYTEYKKSKEQLLREELNELLSWFTTYDEKCMQYQRSLRLGTQWEEDITVWDSQAVVNAARIKEIRQILG